MNQGPGNSADNTNRSASELWRQELIIPEPTEWKVALESRIIGQPEAVARMADVMFELQHSLHINGTGKPRESLLFLGPSGVGKTEICFAAAQTLVQQNQERNLKRPKLPFVLKIDASEYSDANTISRLIGSPPGYVGSKGTDSHIAPMFSQQNLNDHAIHILGADGREQRVTFVIVDEIERASAALRNLLLAVTDRGDLRLADNSRVDVSSVILILTSNAGLAEVDATKIVGFDATKARDLSEEQAKQAQGTFGSPFLGRLDAQINFQALNLDSMEKILDLRLLDAGRLFDEANCPVTFQISDEARNLLLTRNADPRLGARPIGRNVEHLIVDQLKRVPDQIRDKVVEISLDEAGKNLKFAIVSAPPGAEELIHKESREPVARRRHKMYSDRHPILNELDLPDIRRLTWSSPLPEITFAKMHFQHFPLINLYFGSTVGSLRFAYGQILTDRQYREITIAKSEETEKRKDLPTYCQEWRDSVNKQTEREAALRETHRAEEKALKEYFTEYEANLLALISSPPMGS